MDVPFTKMHGCGNDFVVLDERDRPLGLTRPQAVRLADRRLGVGCDQIVSLQAVPGGGAGAVFMRIRNADGGEAGACGNATRCVAALLHAETGLRELLVHTVSGVLAASVEAGGIVRVDMGAPRLGWAELPLSREACTLHLPLAGDPAGLSMGNPHATLFVDDLDAANVAGLGAALEHDPLFPERANIGFAQVLAPDRIRLRVWERGAGLTLACGTGACAALVNAHRRGLCGREATVLVDGGALRIGWGRDGRVSMAGPAETSFRGTVRIEAGAAGTPARDGGAGRPEP